MTELVAETLDEKWWIKVHEDNVIKAAIKWCDGEPTGGELSAAVRALKKSHKDMEETEHEEPAEHCRAAMGIKEESRRKSRRWWKLKRARGEK